MHQHRTEHRSLSDRLVLQADQVLKTLFTSAAVSTRPHPDQQIPETTLTLAQKKHIAGLMRINHTGEVCAQALYQGQALTAHHPQLTQALEQAAHEEMEHLAWCERRIRQLDDRISTLNPLWYTLAFFMGALVGVVGDATNLGFVAETEKQVQTHLESHIKQIPDHDKRTRAILQQMHADEKRHAEMAIQSGGQPLPLTVQQLMRLMARIMTTLVYHC